MKKKLSILLIFLPIIAILWGIGKLYIAYNLASYSGYYVQHMPRKKGTNPELVLIMENLDFIDKPEREDITFDLDGNGTIVKENQYFLTNGSNDFTLWIFSTKEVYRFYLDGSFNSHFLTNDYNNKQTEEKYSKQAEKYVSEILSPILKAQPKPAINLQKLFNQKYQKRFN